MSMEKKGLSLMPFLVLIVLIGLGVSLMFVYYSIVEIEGELESARITLDEDLKERYVAMSNLLDRLDTQIKLEVNQEEIVLDLSQLHDDRGKYIYDILKGDIEEILESEEGIFKGENIYKIENVEEGFLLFIDFFNKYLNFEVDNLSQFKRLQEIDERISITGAEYNKIASNFNKKIASFPNNLVAFFSGIKKVPLYDLNKNY